MYGNADAIGIFRAYQVLNEYTSNAGILKLSDVFTLYYKGASELRPEIGISSTPLYSLFTVQNRWKMFSLFFGFLREDGTGGYFWVPDAPSLWSNVKAPYSISNPNGRDYSNRLYHFAEFWFTRRGSYLALVYYFFRNISMPEENISRFLNAPNVVNPSQFAQSLIN